MTTQRLNEQRIQVLEQARRNSGADMIWYRTLRRVHGHVRYAGCITAPADHASSPFQQRDGAVVLPEYRDATVEDVPAWNTWIPMSVSDTRSDHRLFHDAGVRSRLHRLVVDASGNLTAMVDLMYSEPDSAEHALPSAEEDSDLFDRALNRARASERSRETVLQTGCLWIRDGEPEALCGVGRVLWNRPAIRSAIRQLDPPVERFVGPMWLEASSVGTGMLVWALPSDEVAPPPLGCLPDAARRVGLHLARGETVSGTADKLGRGVETIRTHTRSISDRVGARSRLHLSKTLQRVHWR